MVRILIVEIGRIVCPEDAQTAERALQAIHGMNTASVEHRDGKAVVCVCQNVTNQQVVNALAKAGFNARVV